MNIPEIVRKRVEEIKARNQRQADAKVEAEKRRAREQREFDRLIRVRAEVSKVYAKKICRWVTEFYKTPEAGEMLRLRRAVKIFVAPFWQNKPAPDSVATWTAVELRVVDGDEIYDDAVCVVEYHKGMKSSEWRVASPTSVGVDDLVPCLHPDFLKQWAEEIKSGKVWQYVESSLR